MTKRKGIITSGIIITILIILLIIFIVTKNTNNNDGIEPLPIDKEGLAEIMGTTTEEVDEFLSTELTDEQLENYNNVKDSYTIPEIAELIEDENPNDNIYNFVDVDGNTGTVEYPDISTMPTIEESEAWADELLAGLQEMAKTGKDMEEVFDDEFLATLGQPGTTGIYDPIGAAGASGNTGTTGTSDTSNTSDSSGTSDTSDDYSQSPIVIPNDTTIDTPSESDTSGSESSNTDSTPSSEGDYSDSYNELLEKVLDGRTIEEAREDYEAEGRHNDELGLQFRG